MDLVRLFFGPNRDDTRGDLFFHLAYNGTQYDRAINADNVNTLLAEPFYQVMLSQNYTSGGGADVHTEFKNFMVDVGSYHQMIDDGKAIGVEGVKKTLLDKVYNNPKVPVNVRKFFETHLKVINIAPSDPHPTDNYSDPNTIRFNFVKETSSSDDKKKILFVSTIPLLPQIKGGGNAPDTLRTSYNDGRTHVDAEMKSPVVAEGVAEGEHVAPKETAKSFSLNYTTLIKNVILARDTPIPASSTTAQPIEDLYESVVTGVRYVRDEKGLLRKLKDNGEIDLTMDFEGAELETAVNSTNPNCASTGVDVPGCTDVYKCLLSGKPDTLSECLNRLRDAKMFDVARKEVSKMNPKVAVQLLRTFGFKPRREAGSAVVLPPTFEEWAGRLSKTVDAATAEAIRGNKKLMEYLRAVVTIVRSNPAIINKDLKNGVASDFAKKTGLSVFRNPFPERRTDNANVDGLLFAPQSFGQNMQLPLSLRLANVSGRVFSPNMYGGGSSECPNASNMRKEFNLIYAEMEKNGKVLVDADKERINATIDKLYKLEYNLINLMDDAKLFTRLNTAFNPGQSASTDNVSLKDIVNVRSENITGETLGNLNDCIVRNIGDQAQLSRGLFNNVQKPLLQLLAHGGSDALSQV